MASVYMPYDAVDPPGNEVQELTAYTKRRGAILVMGCDHSQWGSADINKRGECVYDFITVNNLVICNKGNMPTFRNKDRQAVIDMTLTNQDDNFVRDWRVSTDCSFSDHSRITFTLNFNSSLRVPFRDPRRTNWGTFYDKVRTGFEQFNLCELIPPNLEITVNNFTRLLNESYESSCPMKFPGRRKQPKWWTKELQVQRSTVRKSFNRAKLTGLQGDWNNYKVCFNKYKGDLKRAKRTSWRNYCESVDSVNEMSRFRRILSKDPKVIGYIQRADNSWTESSSETLSLLMETHFPGCESIGTRADDQGANMPEGTSHDSRQIEGIVTREKLAWAVKSFDPYKSPGPDGVFPAMLY
ncbi:uncharacterized protein LOC135961367 [Calliphora vicina]|uniref:uncharacterized protein LOC135961367 n=1 Tax=Calliphora vicina TaxID=7373 RepID=UPI00325B8E54